MPVQELDTKPVGGGATVSLFRDQERPENITITVQLHNIDASDVEGDRGRVISNTSADIAGKVARFMRNATGDTSPDAPNALEEGPETITSGKPVATANITLTSPQSDDDLRRIFGEATREASTGQEPRRSSITPTEDRRRPPRDPDDRDRWAGRGGKRGSQNRGDGTGGRGGW